MSKSAIGNLQSAMRKATLRNSKQGRGGGNAAATQAGNREQSYRRREARDERLERNLPISHLQPLASGKG